MVCNSKTIKNEINILFFQILTIFMRKGIFIETVKIEKTSGKKRL